MTASTQQPPADPPKADTDEEKAFWERMSKLIDDKLPGLLNGWFDNKVKELRGNGTSRTGNGGAPTLPKVMARWMFGDSDQ